MEKTRAFLIKNRQSFEDYGYFDDHKIYYEVIENKITSDNCIEACKSLIEGVSKTILGQVDMRNPVTKSRFIDTDLLSINTTFSKMKGKGEDFHVLFKQAIVVLAAYSPAFEKDAVLAVGNGFCKYIGKLRNDRGDISHGRESPKLEKSSRELAKIIESITDILVFSMLEWLVLVEFDQAFQESDFKLNVLESFLIKNEDELAFVEGNEALLRSFNDYLDSDFSLPGKTLYSQALFQQYPDDYEIQFQEYCDSLQKVEENASAS